jgi:hypothetical protein
MLHVSITRQTLAVGVQEICTGGLILIISAMKDQHMLGLKLIVCPYLLPAQSISTLCSFYRPLPCIGHSQFPLPDHWPSAQGQKQHCKLQVPPRVYGRFHRHGPRPGSSQPTPLAELATTSRPKMHMLILQRNFEKET